MSKLIVDQLQKPGGSAFTLPSTAPATTQPVKVVSGVLTNTTVSPDFEILYDGRDGTVSAIDIDVTDVGGKKLRYIELQGTVGKADTTQNSSLYGTFLDGTDTNITTAGSGAYTTRTWAGTNVTTSDAQTGNEYSTAFDYLVFLNATTTLLSTNDAPATIRSRIELGQDLSTVTVRAHTEMTAQNTTNAQSAGHKTTSSAKASGAITTLRLSWVGGSTSFSGDSLLFINKVYEA